MPKFDLELIKKEISKDRAKKQEVTEQTGIDIPQDNFLYSLQQSLVSGVPNKATAKLKVVNERSSNMTSDGFGVQNNNRIPVNEQVISNLQNINPNVQPKRQQFNAPQNNMNNEEYQRNLQEMERINSTRNNTGMADAMAQVIGESTNTNSLRQPPQQMSPNYLVEQVNNAVHTYMTTNMNVVLEQAVKNTMMEIYEKEKIKIALEENKELIGKIVMETLIELKKQGEAKNTAKK